MVNSRWRMSWARWRVQLVEPGEHGPFPVSARRPASGFLPSGLAGVVGIALPRRPGWPRSKDAVLEAGLDRTESLAGLGVLSVAKR